MRNALSILMLVLLPIIVDAQQPAGQGGAQTLTPIPTPTTPSSADGGSELPERRVLAWIQALSWFAAVGTAIYGIRKGQQELRDNRSQRVEELKWKRAQAAKTLNDTMLADPLANC